MNVAGLGALGLIAALGALPAVLASSGLAGIAMILAAGALVSVPLAFHATDEVGARPVDRALDALSFTSVALTIGAVAGPLWASPLQGAFVGVLALLGPVLRRRYGTLAIGGAFAALATVSVGSAALALWDGPWTALAPSVGSGTVVPASAIAIGAGLAAPALGSGPARGRRRAPWLAYGVAALGVIAAAVGAAGRYEMSGEVVISPVVRGVAVFAAAVALPPAPVYASALAGVWFAGPAAAAVPAWSASGIALAPALAAGRVALRGRGPVRYVAAAAGAGVLAAGAAAWPGIAEQRDAVAIALTVVGAVWIAGYAAHRASMETSPWT